MRKKTVKKEMKIAEKKTEQKKPDDTKTDLAEQPQITRKETFYVIVILLLLGIILYFFISGGFGTVKERTIIVNGTQETGQVEIPLTSKTYFGTLPPLGNESAPIVFIEFGDYQCPFCMKFYKETERNVITNYINTGKLRFYYRDFPQSGLHDKAILASHAGRCANEQGKFWGMHDKLYAEHSSWSMMQLSSAKQRFQDYASDLGLKVDKFSECVNSEKYKDDILADAKEGSRLGVTGTPTFLISVPKDNVSLSEIQTAKNNVRGTTLIQQPDSYLIIIEGARDYNDFKAFFDLVK